MVRTGAWISQGWEAVKGDIGMWILVVLVAGLISQVPILNVAMGMGLCYIALRKLQTGGRIEFSDLFKGFDGFYFGQGLLCAIVVGAFAFIAAVVAGAPFALLAWLLGKASEDLGSIIVLLGYVAVAVGALVVETMYVFAPFLIIDRHMGFWEAMGTSKEKVMPNLAGFVGFLIVVAIVYALGAVVCGVGILITAPIAVMSVATAYRDNFAPAEEAAPAPAPAPEPTPPPGV